MLGFVKPPEDLPLSHTANPYWDRIRHIPGDDFQWNYYHVWAPSSTSLLLNGAGSLKPSEEMTDRNALCGEYTWAIPDPISLEFVAEWLKPAAIEIGAGTGYWAWQLSQLGVDILCYDQAPPQLSGNNHWHSPRDGLRGELRNDTRSVFFDVQEGTPEVLKQHADRTLFLCWPPMSEMALECLEHYQGKRLVYIGEGDGGCTADEAFFEKLDKEWDEVAEHRPIQWDGIHDVITVYERRNQHATNTTRKATGQVATPADWRALPCRAAYSRHEQATR